MPYTLNANRKLARVHRNALNEQIVVAFNGLRALRSLDKNDQRLIREWANAGEINMQQLENLLAQYESQLIATYEKNHPSNPTGI